MKQLLTVTIVAASLLLLPTTIRTQVLAEPVATGGPQAAGACGRVGLPALRGTYAFTATAWQDLSEINPALPKGYAPVSIIGAFKVNGNGDVTGWASVNAGGLAMTAEFVNSRFGAPKADCSFPASLSMSIKEFGVVTGPYSYVGVVSGDGAAMEIAFMMLGMGPGAHVELNHAKRISMHVD
jgi:hypothetical protein